MSIVPGLLQMGVNETVLKVENCDRSGKHSLHWASSNALSCRGPEDSHWLGTA